MLRIALVLSLVLALLAIVPLRDRFWSQRPATPFDAQVVAVLDGDTVIVRMPKGGEERVRVIGVDTPEISHDGKPRQCYSLRATSFVRRVALRRHVELTPGRELRDRYGRLLAYVRVAGSRTDLEEQLLRGGFGRTLEIAPNIDRAIHYRTVEQAAQAAGTGLWGACAAA